MDWREQSRNMEVALWKGKYDRAIKVCKAIWDERATIECIKLALANDCELEAAEAWNELDYPVQRLLITAPRYGGPFTTQERAKIKELWEISANELT